jgi:hypothetical protein
MKTGYATIDVEAQIEQPVARQNSRLVYGALGLCAAAGCALMYLANPFNNEEEVDAMFVPSGLRASSRFASMDQAVQFEPVTENNFSYGFTALAAGAFLGTAASVVAAVKNGVFSSTEEENKMVDTTTYQGESTKFTSLIVATGDGQGANSPGANLKPMADGTWKAAGEHPTTFTLENDNGSRGIVDTKTSAAVSWKNADGVELLKPEGVPHCFPAAGTVIKGEFVPEERAKKLSFDRMIFKCNPEGQEDIEYRIDVTMRADSLEYDVIIKNAGASEFNVSTGLLINLSDEAKSLGYKVSATGYTDVSDDAVATGDITIPVGKFKETSFYMKIAK